MPTPTPGALIVVNVSLDTTAKPPVSVEPSAIELKGPTTIVWKISAKSAVPDFHFVKGSLHIAGSAGFIQRQEDDTRCSIYYTNAIKWKGDRAYVLQVEHDGSFYGTGSVEEFAHRAPCIRNM